MIIEIWRKQLGPGLPICFTKGEQPMFVNSEGNLEAITESPPIKAINYYETGAFSGKAYRGPCYVVQFVDSNVRRVIPAEDVREVAWAVPEKDPVKTPDLEG